MKVSSPPNQLPDKALRSLRIRQWHEYEHENFRGLLDKHHYLACPDKRRCHLTQVVVYEEQPVALLIWTTASRKLMGREQYIGWDNRTR